MLFFWYCLFMLWACIADIYSLVLYGFLLFVDLLMWDCCLVGDLVTALLV